MLGFLPNPRGDGIQKAFKLVYVHMSVRTFVSIWFSCVLLGQFMLDPQYFYIFGTPYKMIIRGVLGKGRISAISPFFDGSGNKNISATIRIGRIKILYFGHYNGALTMAKILNLDFF